MDLLPPPPPSLWRMFRTWFKTFQKRWNDWPLVALATLLFLQLPELVNRQFPQLGFAPFTADTLNAGPLALVMFALSSAVSYTMFWLQEPDLYDEYIKCNEQDLLKSDTLTPLQFRKVWRVHSASRSILLHYFWASVVLQAVVIWAVH